MLSYPHFLGGLSRDRYDAGAGVSTIKGERLFITQLQEGKNTACITPRLRCRRPRARFGKPTRIANSAKPPAPAAACPWWNNTLTCFLCRRVLVRNNLVPHKLQEEQEGKQSPVAVAYC